MPGPIESDLVHIGMATLPSRAEACARVIATILQQDHDSWELWVTLNGHPAVPGAFPTDPRIHYVLGDNSLGACAKLAPLAQPGSPLLFTVDDDILYPRDYLSTMLRWFRETGKQAALAVHGSILATNATDWMRDQAVFHFTEKAEDLTPVHIVGTGTSLVRKEWLAGLRPPDWVNRLDPGVSVTLVQAGIRKLVVPRPKLWLASADGSGPSVCFTKDNHRRTMEDLAPYLDTFRQEPGVVGWTKRSNWSRMLRDAIKRLLPAFVMRRVRRRFDRRYHTGQP